MHAETIDSGLHAKSWSLNRLAATPMRQLVLLQDGSGEAEAGDVRLPMSGPALMWTGGLRVGRLRIEAGSTGFRGLIDDRTLVEAIGDGAESVALRYLADRDFVLSLADTPDATATLERCFRAILTETRQARDAAPLMISALLRIVLVTILRISGGSETTLPAIGERMHLLQRFRQLVEMNFRQHWTVARYAQALGVSPDRLHKICTQAVGRTPKALISERLAHEARLRLERSALTIQQLGHSLGFNDPAHFSSFFRKMTGVSPGRFRAALIASRGEERAPESIGFAEWP